MSKIERIADYLVRYFAYRGDPLTNEKLQKLLYYIQVWFLVYKDKDLFEGQTAQAWVFGPVYPVVYNKYKQEGEMFIPAPSGGIETLPQLLDHLDFTASDRELLQEVINHYGTKSAFELELMAHRATPWIEARNGAKPYEHSRKAINISRMKEYYNSLLKVG